MAHTRLHKRVPQTSRPQVEAGDASEGPRDYKVGYGRPPLETRFKKGNTANRRGRSRGSKNLATLLERALDEPVVDENGERRRLTKRDLVIAQLVNKSARADLRATKLLFDILSKVDPRAVAADPAISSAADEAIERVRAKLARRARPPPTLLKAPSRAPHRARRSAVFTLRQRRGHSGPSVGYYP